MDRIDLRIEVPAVSVADLDAPSGGESSAVVAQRIAGAREIQEKRYERHESCDTKTNACADGKVLEEAAPLAEDARTLLNKSMENAKLSARAYYRILRVARTIADLGGEADMLGKAHIAEALSYRRITLS